MQHSGYFLFEMPLLDDRGQPEKILILFKAIGRLLYDELDAAVYEALQKTAPPDHIVVLVPREEVERQSAEGEARELIAALDRAGSIPTILLAGFDRNGAVVRGLFHRCNRATASRLIQELNSASRKSGLSSIAGPLGEKFLVKAPSGFLFQKPSSSCSNYFIRTENAFSGMEQVAFMAFCLLPLASAWERRHGKSLKHIYVDSMSIASVVLTMAHLRGTTGENCPAIKSFHGYEGLESKAFRAPPPNSCWTIISASSGWALAQEWCERTGGKTEDVLVLTSFKHATPERPILHTLTKPADWQHLGDDEVDERGLGRVQIVGEHFLSQSAFPKVVGILTTQAPKNLTDGLTGILGRDLFRCNRHVGGSALPKELFADGSRLLTLEKFEEWLVERLTDLPIKSIRHIVFQDDASSRALALKCEKHLSERDGGTYELHRGKSIASRKAELEGGVLIVAAVIGHGSRLLSISRDLRNRHPHGFRQYLVGLALPPSVLALAELERNLKFAPKFAKYDVQFFRAFALGHHRHPNSWTSERAQLEKISKHTANAFIRERTRKLGAFSTGLEADVFWPRLSDMNVLQLRAGFAFWGGKIYSESLCELMLTIKIVLQNCRENRELPIDKRLSSQTLQQVVLDPGIFLQYDDGAIQASFLRCATDAELDYSHDSDLSGRALAMLKHILIGVDKTKGEASAEFLMALLCGKLRLTKSDFKELVSYLQSVKTSKGASRQFNILVGALKKVSS